MKRTVEVIAGLGLLVLTTSVYAGSRTSMVVPRGDTESRVQFVSDAPLEKITGVGDGVSGAVQFDPSAVKATKGTLTLDVASIKTNLALRDEHLQGPDWLDAKKYPKIKFTIAKVEGSDALAPNRTQELKVKGKLFMHGVTRDEVATAKVRWVPADGVHVRAEFNVNLTRYNISVPSLVRLKVSDEINLNIMLKVKPKK